MYLAELTIKNFRKLRDAKLEFQPGLNVLVGPNKGSTPLARTLSSKLIPS
jgi:predicted ATP-dependent endonuclease of OLD family